MKKAAIFDMDGTLWDTTPLLFEVWNRVMQNYEETRGRFLSLEDIRSLMGKTMYEIGELTMPGVPEKRMEEIFNGCIDAEDAELSAYCKHAWVSGGGTEGVCRYAV